MKITSQNYKFIDTLVGWVCIGLVGIFAITTFATSMIEYNQYETEYENNLKEVFSKTPKAPESVVIDNDFITYDENGYSIKDSKSEYKNIFTCMASEAYFYSSVNNNNHGKIEVNNTKNIIKANIKFQTFLVAPSFDSL